MTPVKLLYLLPLAAALTHGQGQCVLELASQSDGGSRDLPFLFRRRRIRAETASSARRAWPQGGRRKSLHTVQAPFSWQTGMVYTVTAVITAAGPQQLSINGQSAGSVTGAFNPAQGTLYGSNVTIPARQPRTTCRRKPPSKSPTDRTPHVAPNGNTPIPLPLVLLAGGPVSWQTALHLESGEIDHHHGDIRVQRHGREPPSVRPVHR